MNKKRTAQLRSSFDTETGFIKKATPDLRGVVLVAAGIILLVARLGGITLPDWNEAGENIAIPNFTDSSVSAEARHIFYLPMPINDVDRDVLISLPNIGPKLADKIIAQRQNLGKIQTPEELLAIHGISRKKLARLLPEITFNTTDR